MAQTNQLDFSTRCIHAGQEPDPTTGAVMMPIYTTSTYLQQSPGVHKGYDYARTKNPTRMAFERCIADLEGGSAAFAFASGLAAISTTLEALEGGRDRGQARGEGECRAASFEIGDAAFECHARRVLGAGVVVALVHSRALLKVSRGGVDRHHDGAGRGIRFLAGVDAARREIELVCLCHSSLAIPVITGVSRRFTDQ